MSDHLDPLVADAINRAVTNGLKSKVHNDAIRSTTYEEIGTAMRHMAASVRPPLSVEKFIIKPRKLVGGGCIALVNFSLDFASNAFRLVVSGDLINPTLTAYQENAGQLNASKFLPLTEYQRKEVLRQLTELSANAPNYEVPAIFTLLIYDHEIEGYEYASEPIQETALLPLGAGKKISVVEVQKNEPTTAVRGPTPVPLSQMGAPTPPIEGGRVKGPTRANVR